MKYTKRGSGPLSLPPRNSCEAQGNPARPPGIEGVEMRKIYYNLVPSAALRIPLGAIGLLGSFGSAQQPPLRTASLESHEGLTISATPLTDAAKYKEKFPKKSPYAAGILAVQVSFRNDSDDSMKVNLSRIRLTVHQIGPMPPSTKRSFRKSRHTPREFLPCKSRFATIPTTA